MITAPPTLAPVAAAHRRNAVEPADAPYPIRRRSPPGRAWLRHRRVLRRRGDRRGTPGVNRHPRPPQRVPQRGACRVRATRWRGGLARWTRRLALPRDRGRAPARRRMPHGVTAPASPANVAPASTPAAARRVEPRLETDVDVEPRVDGIDAAGARDRRPLRIVRGRDSKTSPLRRTSRSGASSGRVNAIETQPRFARVPAARVRVAGVRVHRVLAERDARDRDRVLAELARAETRRRRRRWAGRGRRARRTPAFSRSKKRHLKSSSVSPLPMTVGPSQASGRTRAPAR